MVVLICQFGSETNTFAPGRLDFSMLAPKGWTRADRVETEYGNTNSYLGGAIRAIREAGETPMPIDLLTNNGNFGAGPLMTGECAKTAMDHICDQVRRRLGQFDGIYFALHGAGCCEFDEDLEGYTLRRLREVVGKQIPVFCSLDLHANVTQEMVSLADALFSIKEVPHNDCCEAGYFTAKRLIAYLRGEEKPVMAFRKLPLLVSPVRGSTLSGPGKQVKDYFSQYCRQQGLLDCVFVHGFSAKPPTIRAAVAPVMRHIFSGNFLGVIFRGSSWVRYLTRKPLKKFTNTRLVNGLVSVLVARQCPLRENPCR